MTEACENCGEALKIGMLSANQRLPQNHVRIIELAENLRDITACNKCGDGRYSAAKTALIAELGQLRGRLTAMLSDVPIVSLQSPHGWQYEPISIITAQTVTGTGIFSDVASAFTDVFGTQSKTYNAKIREGENLCKDSLRAQALEIGGNAVLAVDVDYAEVGGQRAMLMVCMTGTAVRLTAVTPSSSERLAATAEGKPTANRIRVIQDALQR